MPSGMKDDRLVNRREKTKERRRPKMVKKKEDEETFNEVLDYCLKLFSNSYENGKEDVFEYLDPLVSDTQCHIHSIVLLNILQKCIKNKDSKNNSLNRGIKMLEDKEREILSYGILLTLLKVSVRDDFGLIVNEMALRHLNGTTICSKNRERYWITKSRKIFNSYSVNYIKMNSDKNLQEMFKVCGALSPNLGLKFLPCYASIYAVISYMEKHHLPMIISFKEIKIDGDYHVLISSGVVYYEYRESGVSLENGETGDSKKTYYYKKELNDFDKNLPTITFDCYRLIDADGNIDNDNENNNEIVKFFQNCDIKSCLLVSSAGHIQLPVDSELPDGFEDVEYYSRSLYKIDENFSIQYMKHYELAKDQNMIEARYSKIAKNSKEEEEEEEGNSYMVERRRDHINLGMDHIHLSNYSREFDIAKNYTLKSKVYKNETFKLNMNKLIVEAANKLIDNKNRKDQARHKDHTEHK